MRPTNPETRIEYRYTTTKGVTVSVTSVPVTTAREDSGEEHEVFSMGVAMRLEELIKRVKNPDAEARSAQHLEF